MSDEPRTSTLSPVDGYPIALATPADHAVGAQLPICSALEKLAETDGATRSTLLEMPWFSPVIGSGCLDLGDGPYLDPSALRGLSRTIGSVVPERVRAVEVTGWVQSFVEGLVSTRAPGLSLVPWETASGSQSPPGGAGTKLVVAGALLTRAFHQGSLLVDRPVGARFLTTEVPLPSGDLGLPDSDLRKPLRDLLDQLREPDQIGELAGYWKDVTFWSAFLDHLVQELDRWVTLGRQGVASGFDVQLLTEFAWLLIVKDSALYPGWSDLLVGLMGSRAEHLRGNRQAPKQLTSSITKEVERLLEPATTESWKSWLTFCDEEGGEVSGDGEIVAADRRAFYSRIAHLLSTQGEFREALHPARPALDEGAVEYDFHERSEVVEEAEAEATATRRRLTSETSEQLREAYGGSFRDTEWPIPQPTAIVTSFDIELEMAFWAHRQRFVVVVPMLASPEGTERPGRVVWLAAIFDPSDRASGEDLAAFRRARSRIDGGDVDLGRLEDLVHLRQGCRDWLPVSDTGFEGPKGDWSNVPTIVRLSGAPLLEVEKGNVDPKAREYARLGTRHPDFQLIPALTIDEYSSLRLSAHEVYSLTVRDGLPTGLPSRLLNGTDTMSRVWVSFGVQVDDPATRSRLFTQLSVAAIAPSLDQQAQDDGTSGSSEGAPGGTRRSAGSSGPLSAKGATPMATGLAINRRFNDADTAIMRWLGFEFAEIEVKDLIADVDHYTRKHLEWALGRLRSDELKRWWPVTSDASVRDLPFINWHRASDTGCRHHPPERPR